MNKYSANVTETAAEFADIRDIQSAHWHYAGSPYQSQETLEISFPGRRVSIQLDRQIKELAEQNAGLVAALSAIISERDSAALADDPAYLMIDRAIEQARAALKSAKL